MYGQRRPVSVTRLVSQTKHVKASRAQTGVVLSVVSEVSIFAEDVQISLTKKNSYCSLLLGDGITCYQLGDG
ncbi:hypothetical protein J6590_043169 [Homalodisca vitripennis]|nr:hypothetical protein J6590_043169 [Homalodisca vitripennis]